MDNATEKEIRCVSFCPHCGNMAPQKLVYEQDFEGQWYSADSGEKSEDPSGPTSTYYVAVCETCSEVLVYVDVVEEFDRHHFSFAQLSWPRQGLHHSVPKIVSDSYLEAERIMNLAPNAFAMQIRRALEALCDDRGAKNGTLQNRLGELVSRGEIPKTLSEMSDVLRILGNLGAHAVTQGVKPIQVSAIDDFFRAIVEYVYIAPSKLIEFKERLKKLSDKNQHE